MIQFGPMEVADFGVIERATLELGDQGLVLIRGDNRDTEAADSNGSGKTTLFKALSWALFGEVVGEGRIVDVIRRGARKASVLVGFEVGSRTYTVERERTSSATTLTLLTDGVSTTGRTIQDTEARIAEVLGLDWHAFRNTVLYGQGDLKRFADPSVTDSERKAILKRILRLEQLDRALLKTREELKVQRDNLATAELDRSKAGATLGEAKQTLERVELLHSSWKERNDEDIEKAEFGRELLQTEVEECGQTAKDTTRLRKLEEQVVEVIAPLPDLRSALRTTRSEVDGLKRNQREVDRQVATAEAKAGNVKEQVDELEGTEVCPFCRTPLAESSHTQEHMERLREKWREAEGEVKKLRKNAKTAASKVDAGEKDLTKQEAAITDLEGLEDELKDVRDRLRKSEAAETKLERLKEKLQSKQEELERLREAMNPHAALKEEQGEVVEEAQERADASQADVDRIKAEMVPLQFWEAAFGNKGLPSMIMDSVIPILTENANRYLQILADGDIQVELATETALKNGGTKEELSINLVIEGNRGVTPSGGQQRKIAIAIDLALMDLVATREGAQIDMLLLDEVLDGLDHEGKARIVELLRQLRSVRSSILVVSHDDSIAEHFEKVLTVVKDGGKATLEVS